MKMYTLLVLCVVATSSSTVLASLPLGGHGRVTASEVPGLPPCDYCCMDLGNNGNARAPTDLNSPDFKHPILPGQCLTSKDYAGDQDQPGFAHKSTHACAIFFARNGEKTCRGRTWAWFPKLQMGDELGMEAHGYVWMSYDYDSYMKKHK